MSFTIVGTGTCRFGAKGELLERTDFDFARTGYFDDVASTIGGDQISTAALKGSTEEEQFEHH